MDTDQYQFYKNAQYTNTRNEKKTLILDIDDSDGSLHLCAGTEFNIDLFEPLKIDKHSEVYLDNFLTFNSKPGLETDDMAFCLTINEFNNNGNVASNTTDKSKLYNKLIIPNENDDLNNHHLNIIHKSKKFNYICDINPYKLGRISGKITNLAGGPIFHGGNVNEKFTYTLAGSSLTSTAVGGQTFNSIVITNTGTGDANISLNGNGFSDANIAPAAIQDTNTAITGTILYTTNTGTTIFYFTASIDLFDEQSGLQKQIITTGSTSGSVRIDFKSGGTIVAQFNNVGKSDILRKGSGRFIAEFLIISKEN
jgi:hypothetical protein